MSSKKGKNSSLMRLTKDVKRMKKFFKKPEVKFEITALNTTSDNAGAFYPLMQQVASGTAHDQRIGNSVDLLSINLRIMNRLADAGYNNVRYAIIKCRNPPPTAVELFETTSYATFGGVYAEWDRDLVEKVYLDKNITLNQQISGANVSKFGKHFIKMPMTLHYNDVNPGSLNEHILLVLTSDSVLAPHLIVTGKQVSGS